LLDVYRDMDSKLFLGTKVTRPEEVRYSATEGIWR